MQKQPQAGHIIVLEGGDGSGKGSQLELLRNYCAERDIRHKVFDFPRYDSFYGGIVAQFLRGEFGDLDAVSPYLAALTFALDRKDARDEIVQAKREGNLILMNRYVTSNYAHQGSKMKTPEEQAKIIDWIKRLEYEHHELPHEDVVIYLQVSVSVSEHLTAQKSARAYLAGSLQDIQEKDHAYRTRTYALYNTLAERSDNWHTLSCEEHGTIRSRESIHRDIVALLRLKGFIS